MRGTHKLKTINFENTFRPSKHCGQGTPNRTFNDTLVMKEFTKGVLCLGLINLTLLFFTFRGFDQQSDNSRFVLPTPSLPSKATLMPGFFENEKGEDISYNEQEPMPIISALVLSYPDPSADTELRRQYALGAAMMVFAWFSFCYGQLQQARNNDNDYILSQNAQEIETLGVETLTPSRVSCISNTTPDKDEVLESFNHLFDQTNDEAFDCNAEQRDPYIFCDSPTFLALQLTCQSCATRLEASWRFCCSCGSTVYVTPGVEGQRDPAETVERQKRGHTQQIEHPLLICSRSRSEETNLSAKRALKRTNSTGSIYSITTAKSETVDDIGTTMIQNGNRFLFYVPPNSPELVSGFEELVLNDTFSIDKFVPAEETELDESSGKYPVKPETAESSRKYLQSEDVTAVKFRKTDSVCIGSRFWPIGQMVSQYPPKWGHPYKKIIAETSPFHVERPDEWIRASRWSRPSALPKRVKRAKVYVESGYFSYDSLGAKGGHKTMHWHVNLAGNRLFSYGKGALFNENEVQVLEHPCLASLAMAIKDVKNHGVKGLSTLTHEPQVGPTPILIKGAQRRCEVNTRLLDPEFFADASEDEIRHVTNPCKIPMITNIVALPNVSAGTSNKYTVAQIRRLFIYAYTGFRAVVLESGGRKPVLHTGFWCCGSDLEGNKGLTAAIQILAAGTAGIKYIHFAPGDNSAFDRSAMWHGINVANALHAKSFADAVKFLVAVGYYWGNQGPSHLPYQPPAMFMDLLTGKRHGK
jgi:Poly (ADP-ribose) glycohydrolase (PARG)